MYLLDRQSGVLEVISRNAETTGYSSFNSPSDMSDDGRYVAWLSRAFEFSGPPNPTADQRAIWVLDRQTGQRVNVTTPLGPLLRDSDISLDLGFAAGRIGKRDAGSRPDPTCAPVVAVIEWARAWRSLEKSTPAHGSTSGLGPSRSDECPWRQPLAVPS